MITFIATQASDYDAKICTYEAAEAFEKVQKDLKEKKSAKKTVLKRLAALTPEQRLAKVYL